MAHQGEAAPLAIGLVSEISTLDLILKGLVSRTLPRGMELSQFSVLNHLAGSGAERTPAQLARLFNVTKGAMTNTLQRLEAAGWVHVRPDWDDGRRKLVAISPAGERARAEALAAVAPVLDEIVGRIGADAVREALPLLRRLRLHLADTD